VVTLLAVSFGASYGWTCHGSTECQPSSLLATDTSLQSDVQLLQISAGPNASSITGTNGGPPTLIAGVNIVAKPGSTLNEVLSEADDMQTSMRTVTGSTLNSNYALVFVQSSSATTVIVGGHAVVYVYLTVWLISGAGTVPADATAQSLLLDAYNGMAGWSKGIPGSVQLGATISEATSSSAQSVGDPHLQNIHGERFDVMKPGEHVLIHIPRQERPENTLLHIQAFARTLGADCTDTYFVRINVTGKWPSALRPGGFTFKADDPDSGAESKWMSLHGMSNGLQVKVVHGQTQQGIRYLNFFIKHLDRSGFLVGGLLGEDDHEDASTLPRACERRMAL